MLPCLPGVRRFHLELHVIALGAMDIEDGITRKRGGKLLPGPPRRRRPHDGLAGNGIEPLHIQLSGCLREIDGDRLVQPHSLKCLAQ